MSNEVRVSYLRQSERHTSREERCIHDLTRERRDVWEIGEARRDCVNWERASIGSDVSDVSVHVNVERK